MLRRWATPDWQWTHLPFGEFRNAVTAARLARMGVRKGYPDFALFCLDGRVAFLEVKRPGGRLSEDQQRIADHMRRAGAVSFALAYQKHNAAQAEYDRLAALGSPEAPEILPGGIMSTDAMPRFMDTSKFSLGSPNDPISLGAFPSGHWRRFRLVPVQGPHYPDPRHHFRPVALGDQRQHFHRGLPFGSTVLRFRQFGDESGGVPQRQELAPVRQDDRVDEPRGPGHLTGTHAGLRKHRSHFRAALATGGAEVRLDVRQPHMIRPAVCADRDVMAASVIRQ